MLFVLPYITIKKCYLTYLTPIPEDNLGRRHVNQKKSVKQAHF